MTPASPHADMPRRRPASSRCPYHVGVRLSPADIADAVEAGLRAKFAELDCEQAVYGLDSLDELALHPLIAKALETTGFGVHREQRYPGDRMRRRISEGERCDLVITADGRGLVKEGSRGTLFDDPNACALEDAFWLEVKIVSQFTSEGPNANYSSQLLSTVRQDITKLAKDPGILQAGLLIILFVRDDAVAEHDLKIWQDRCLERGLPLGAPSRRTIAFSDRHGNGCCAIAVYPVPHL